MTPTTWPIRPAAVVAALAAVAAAVAVGTIGWPPGAGAAPAGTSGATSGAPSTPTKVCGVAAQLTGPSTPPAGAVGVTPTQTLPSVVAGAPAGTTFWLSAGTYRLGTGPYDQVVPRSGDTLVGGPGATIDGQFKNLYAFTGHAQDVTIEYLTIEDFGGARSDQTQGVVNHNAGKGWTIDHDTVAHDAGAGVLLGSDDVLRADCLTENGQYGFSAYSTTGVVSDVTVTGDEVSDNDTADWTRVDPGCGCSGGAKFWDTHGAVVTGNYVHGNENVGLWMDTDNAGFDIADNYIADNYAEGVVYEISYNARIADNTFIRNDIGAGRATPRALDGALYVSESGSDPRVPGPYGTTFAITDNVFTDNWGGVVLYENADRFCGSPDNSSTGWCTLVDPGQVNRSTCTEAHLRGARPDQGPVDYYDDCRWRTQRVAVTGNTFAFTPSAVSPACTVGNECGLQGLFSQYGTSPTWSPYQGDVVEKAITATQRDRFADNVYRGPWHFAVYTQGNVVSYATWRHRWSQDAGSTLSGG